MGSINTALEVYKEIFPGKIKIKTTNEAEGGGEGDTKMKGTEKNEKKGKREEEDGTTPNGKKLKLKSLFTMVGTRKKIGNGIFFVS